MKLSDFQKLLRAHFSGMLESQKDAIRAEGRLPDVVTNSFASSIQKAQDPTTDSLRQRMQRDAMDDFMVQELLKKAGTSADLSANTQKQLRAEYRLADTAYARAVLKFNSEHEGYDFQDTAGSVQAPANAAPQAHGSTLGEIVSEFFAWSKVENKWIDKTAGEKQEHIDLLYEIHPKDTPIADLGHVQARNVRQVLKEHPVNRHKDARTKGKSLDEIRLIPDLKTLHPLTINKYLQTYKGLFNWAKRHKYCSDNPFEGLSLNTKKANEEPPRLPFSQDALDTIFRAVVGINSEAGEHHKWGTLLAMYSGARLNEVAQLYLSDVRSIDGVLCIDINKNDPKHTRKKLKNNASKRIVPVHPRLLKLGFVDYVERMHKVRGNVRLFPQLTYTPSDGYGRNLGRWVNESLLPKLDLKTDQHTFHSLRHSMVGRLFAAEIPEAHVIAIVGHEPGTTTLKVYNRNGFPPKVLLSALEKVL